MLKKLFEHQLSIVILTIFIDALGIGILFPIIPLLLADPSSTFYLLPKGYDPSFGYVLLGFLTAIFPLMQFFSTPILGQLSDKYGRKKVLAVSIFGTAIGYLFFAVGIILRSLPLLFISRALDGITGGNISVAQASIADLTKPQDRAKNFGLIGAAFGMGFILGPFLGGKLSDPLLISWFSPAVPFWFAASLSFINTLSVIFFFTETHKTMTKGLSIKWGESIKNIIRALNMSSLRPIFLTGFLFFSGFTFFVTFISVYLINKFGFTQGGVGDFFSYVGIWIAFTQIVLTRKLAKYFNEKQILRITIIGDGIAIGLMFLPNLWWQVFLIAPLIAICNGLSFANLTGLISRSASPEIQGEVLGINASIQALAQLLPPVLGGLIAAIITPETPLLVSSSIIILAGIFFIVSFKPKILLTS